MSAESLFKAIEAGDNEAVRALLAQDRSLAKSRVDGVSALMLATYYNHRDIAHQLEATGISLDIFEASATGHVERIFELLETAPGLVNSVAPDGFTPLTLACYFKRARAARLLVEEGADVNKHSDNPFNVAPLHSAVAHGDVEIVKMLLAHRADVNAKQQGGLTPLHSAAHQGSAELVRILFQHDADLKVKDDKGRTAADIAAEHGHAELVPFLS